ncbi:unnamed protein product [Rhizoctonia solani]|uniref:DNA repair protein SWI5 homolog n=1 Tax=Rhizoctonia solani TaxID=456999 RepID=A0A8H2XEE4_9AGAM|nr:unnamed protein product [Rhizoctonia solani]
MNHSKGTISQEVESLQKDIDTLQKLLGDEDPQKIVDRHIKLLHMYNESKDAAQIVDRHIKLLHMYNESKDAAQVILGRLATIKQTTVAKMHEEYDLPLQD